MSARGLLAHSVQRTEAAGVREWVSTVPKALARPVAHVPDGLGAAKSAAPSARPVSGTAAAVQLSALHALLLTSSHDLAAEALERVVLRLVLAHNNLHLVGVARLHGGALRAVGGCTG